MAVTASVVSDFETLQTYYRNLNWIYRWFLPKAIRTQLDDLEHCSISAENLAGRSLNLVCASVAQGGWYTRLMVYLFSGLYQFANTNFMEYAKRLHEINALTQQNIQVLAEVKDIKATYDALVLLKETGKTPLPNHIREVVAAISQIGEIQVIPLNSKKRVYKDLAVHNQPAKLAEAIQMVLAAKITGVYDQLLAHRNPTFLAESLSDLKIKNLLSSDMLEMVSNLVDPRDFTISVLALYNQNALDQMRLKVLLASENPKALADLILEFATARKIDADTLDKLESHRININKIIAAKLSLDAKQRLDLQYCDTLMRGLETLHAARLSDGDIGVRYCIFLQNIESSQRDVYAQLLVLVFDTHQLGYSENFYETTETPVIAEVDAILESLQRAPDAATLLTTLQSQKRLTKKELNGFIAQQNLAKNSIIWQQPNKDQKLSVCRGSEDDLEADAPLVADAKDDTSNHSSKKKGWASVFATLQAMSTWAPAVIDLNAQEKKSSDDVVITATYLSDPSCKV